MRKKKFRLVSFILIVVITLFVNSVNVFATGKDKDKGKDKDSSKNSNKTYTIALDAGHGGSDSGAVSSKYNVTEAQVAIAVVKKAKKLLEAEGHKVIYCSSMVTTGSKTPIPDRIEKAKKENADICLSIHMNAGGSSTTNRLEVYIDDNAGDDSKKAAKAILKSMEDKIGSYVADADKSKNAVCKDSSSQHSDLGMTKPAGFDFPTVLLEGGFISCDKVAKDCKAGTYQDKYAEAVADGVLKALGESGISGSNTKQETNTNTTNQDNGFTSYVDEYDKHTLQNYVEVPSMAALTAEERAQINALQEEINNKDNKVWYEKLRVGYMLVGLLIIIYSLALYLSYWVDKFGILYELRLLPLLSFGKYEIKNEENVEKDKKYVDMKKSIILLVEGVLLGMFILSGLSFRLINYLVELLYSIGEWF